jgi:FkbM family methyltransferase
MSDTRRLIFDIGFNNGDDTFHYLGQGYDVVAVEANPVLAEAGRKRFADAIAAGRLHLLGVGIAEQSGQADFYVNELNDGWSSFLPDAGMRGGRFSVISVPTITIADLFARFGTPYYLKIDIEGHDWFCIRDMPATPPYVSIEAHRLEYLAVLYVKGYRQFKVVNQADHFPNSWSGPVSDTYSEWDTLETVAYDWLHVRLGRLERSSLGNGWFDFHAKLGGDELSGGQAKKPFRFRRTRLHYTNARFRLRTAIARTRLGRAIKSFIRRKKTT